MNGQSESPVHLPAIEISFAMQKSCNNILYLMTKYPVIVSCVGRLESRVLAYKNMEIEL